MDENKLLDIALERGVSEILPSKEELKELLKKRKITLYQGFDPSSPNLHIGHLIGIRKLAQFQKLGHKVIFLIGDFTGIIGDPTDKDAARKRLTKKQVEENAKTYQQQVKGILDFTGENKAEIRYNSEWLGKLSMEELIEIASNFTVQQFLERDMFRKRLQRNKPIYLHEFLYPLMQGYDSSAMEVDLEIGGNDQLFNILAGRALEKNLRDKDKFVLTTKLMVGSNNQKMGKSEGNTINLNDEPNEMYGKIMALPDSVLKAGLELLTDLPYENANENPMQNKKDLALSVVEQIHGEKAAKDAEGFFKNTFQKGDLPDNVETITVNSDKLSLIEAVSETNLVESKSQAKRLISESAVEIDGEKLTDPTKTIQITKDGIIVKIGKARFAKLISK
jgi:tyrosyl-tRNA synthetase